MLPLPRPQYVPVPEALISVLAWKAFDVDLGGEPTGLVYRIDSEKQEKQPKTFTLRATEPVTDRKSTRLNSSHWE